MQWYLSTGMGLPAAAKAAFMPARGGTRIQAQRQSSRSAPDDKSTPMVSHRHKLREARLVEMYGGCLADG